MASLVTASIVAPLSSRVSFRGFRSQQRSASSKKELLFSGRQIRHRGIRRQCRAVASRPEASQSDATQKNLDDVIQQLESNVIELGPDCPVKSVESLTMKTENHETSDTNVLFSSPLLRTPLSGSVANAGRHYELPTPPVSCRNLMEQALFGDMCTTMAPMDHRRAGWPVASLVDFATDSEGTPIFSLSPMAMHTRNIKVDPRCSLVVEMPGWRGLASARLTLFGTVRKVPDDKQDLARRLFKSKHSEENMSYGTSEFPLYALTDIKDVYYVGGYGQVKWVDPIDYLSSAPDKVCDRAVQDPLELLNNVNAEYRLRIPSLYPDCSRAKIIAVDRCGMDVRLKTGEGHYVVQRIRFHGPAESYGEVRDEVEAILSDGFKKLRKSR